MTRARIASSIVFLVVAAVLVTRSHDRSDSMYRVDAVFDSGRGVLPGGKVKIAGADVGVIDDIRLTAGRKALVEMRVDKRFGPFRSDAHCSIRGEGLVGAAVVNCQPGTTAGAPLQTGERGHPTLPLARTSVPVSITDFFEIWKAPVSERLRIILNDLGMGLAGRGGDLNDLLLRANPSLLKARRALAIVVAQRHALARSITDSNHALAALAADSSGTRRFIREAARTSHLTADREGALGAGIAGLPALLRRSDAALTELDALNRTALPLVKDLHVSAPALESLAGDAVPFARDALPAVRSLKPALAQGRGTLQKVAPFARSLQRFTRSADPAGRLQSDLQVSLRDSGAYENLLKVFYDGAASLSRYDAVSHLDPSHLLVPGCAAYGYKHDDSCDFHYVKQPAAASAKRKARKPATAPVATPGDRPAAAGATPLLGHKPGLPIGRVPKTGIDPVDDAIHNLLGFLLG